MSNPFRKVRLTAGLAIPAEAGILIARQECRSIMTLFVSMLYQRAL
jgi:hypothetical protein